MKITIHKPSPILRVHPKDLEPGTYFKHNIFGSLYLRVKDGAVSLSPINNGRVYELEEFLKVRGEYIVLVPEELIFSIKQN